jgi:uncharacterized protein (DUF305 family)
MTFFAWAVPAASWADGPAPQVSQRTFETTFMENMIDHHTMAIEMSRLCLGKAAHEKLKSLCEEIINAQEDEIGSMTTWLKRWYSIKHEPDISGADMRDLQSLASLGGKQFEVAFLKMMGMHHYKAVVEGKECVEKAYHDELDSLCHNIVGSQKSEIRLMQRWLRSWYGVCGYGPKV